MDGVIDYQHLRDAVKRRREELNLRKCRLSEQTGIPKSVLTKFLERGDKPNAETFFKLCAWLGMSPHEFTTYARDKVRVTSKASLPAMLGLIMDGKHELDLVARLELCRWLKWNYEFFVKGAKDAT